MEGRATAAAEIRLIADKLKGREFGSIRVVGVDGELAIDQDGDAVLRLRLTLSDPPGDDATWPLDDVDALQQDAQRLVGEVDAELPFVVTELYPESPDSEEDISDGSADGLSRALDAEPEQ
jgi:hypothetical protein